MAKAQNVQCVCRQFGTLPDYQHLCSLIQKHDPDLKSGGIRDMVLEWSQSRHAMLLELYSCCKNWGTVIEVCNRNIWAVDTLVNVFKVSVFDIINVSESVAMNSVIHLLPHMSFEEACVLLQQR